MKEFQKGQRIKTVSGGELEVIQKLGEGGQGVVYKVNYNGKPLALNWYFGNKLNNADKFYRNIQNNIKQGTPTGAFLWPLLNGITPPRIQGFLFVPACESPFC